MADFETIIVALGCAERDAGLIGHASLLARLGGTREVRFVHILDPKNHASAAQVREQLHSRVAEMFHGPARTECDVLQGPVTDRLLAYIDEIEADLVVVGGRRRVLASRLAMLAACSVAVIPEDSAPRLSHIAAAIDFSEAASDTLEWVTALASGDPTIRCTAIHVMTHESVDLFADQESQPEQAEEMRRILARADRHGVPVQPHLVQGGVSPAIGRQHHFSPASSIEGADVAAAILTEAEAIGADCLAMSTRGRSASALILLGSVTEKVIERSTIPLLVVKHFGASLKFADVLLGRASKHLQGAKAN